MKKSIEFLIRFLFVVAFFALNFSFAQTKIIVTSADDPINPLESMEGDPAFNQKHTLRWAMNQANKETASVIYFNIPQNESRTIYVKSQLPSLYKECFIDAKFKGDGSLQDSYVKGAPVITIDGSLCNTSLYYLFQNFGSYFETPPQISPNKNGVRGIRLQNFNTIYGFVQIQSRTNILIEENIGTINNIGGCSFFGLFFCKSGLVRGNVFEYGGNDLKNSSGANRCYLNRSEAIRIGDGTTEGGNVFKYVAISIYNQVDTYKPTKSRYCTFSKNLFYRFTADIEFFNFGYFLSLNSSDPTESGNEGKSKPIINFIPSGGYPNVSGTSNPGDKIELFGSEGENRANVFLTSVVTNSSGVWTANLSANNYEYVSATATDSKGNTSEFAISNRVINPCYYVSPIQITNVTNLKVTFSPPNYTGYDSRLIASIRYDFGDNSQQNYALGAAISHLYKLNGKYTVTQKITFKDGFVCTSTKEISLPSGFCPSTYFLPVQNTCGSGEVQFSIYECPNALGWELEKVKWVFESGTAEVETGDLSATHTYTTSGTRNVAAVVLYSNGNGQMCQTPVKWVSNAADISRVDLCNAKSFENTMPVSVLVFQGKLVVAKAGTTAPVTQISAGQSYDILLTFTGPPVGSSASQLYIDGALAAGGLMGSVITSPVKIFTTSFTEGQHTFELRINQRLVPCQFVVSTTIDVSLPPDPCNDCFTLRPEVGKRYWISAWVKENQATPVLAYNFASIKVEFIGASVSPMEFKPTGDIVEGWQRITGEFIMPSNTETFVVKLSNANNNVSANFDDIRIHPFNASMKSYVYDPNTFLLSAELDDNNYATFYEYDKEGQLIRIKKETERGIMTIQESRSSNPKK